MTETSESMDRPSRPSRSLDIEEKKSGREPGVQDYIFRGRYYFLLAPIGLGHIITASTRIPALIVIPLVLYVIQMCILFYLRCSSHHQQQIQREWSGSTVRYYTGIPYNPESVIPWWFPWFVFIVAPPVLSVILLCHLLLYGGDLSTCGNLDKYLIDGRCTVEQGSTYAFACFYLPVIYAGVGCFDISESTQSSLLQLERELVQNFPMLEQIILRAKERKVRSLWSRKMLVIGAIVAILLFTFIPLMVNPRLVNRVQNTKAMALFWFSLPVGAMGLSIIPHVLHGLLVRYHICCQNLDDLQHSAKQELEPLSKAEHAGAWWALRQYYVKSYFPLIYGLNSMGLAVSLVFTLICVLIVVIVVFAPLPGTTTSRFLLILPFFMIIPLGTLALLFLLREATLIREAQIGHGEFLKREQHKYFLTLYSTSPYHKKERSKEGENENHESFFKFVEYTYDLIANFDSYPTVFGIVITPAFLNLILTYLGTGIVSVATKIGVSD